MTDIAEKFNAPVLLTEQHDHALFQSGEPVLDDWLRNRALENLKLAASRTYVTCVPGSKTIAGFYCLSMAHISAHEVLGSMRRNMPKLIPSVILGRLAVDQRWQGQGVGAILLKDAIDRSVRAAMEVAARLIIVHAISLSAEEFYQRYGFERLQLDTPTLALDILKYQRLNQLS